MTNLFKNVILETKILNSEQHFQEMDADLHIAFGIDKNFARGMGILINSILLHNLDEKIAFHIFTDDILASDIERLKLLTQYKQLFIRLYYIDIRAFENLPVTLAWSYATYYRFIMGKVLYGKVDHVLYLDADILCLGSLKDVKKIDMEENIVMAICEDGLINVNRLSLKQGKYFNAGVLYIDINKWNDAQIAEHAVQMLDINPEQYPYLDQDVLNILLDEKTKFIEKKWNYLYDMRKTDDQLLENVLLVHFIGDKPWQQWSQHHFMVQHYTEYMKISPWADVPLTEPRHYKEKKRLAKSFIKRGEYMEAFKWYCKYGMNKFKSVLSGKKG